MLSIRMLAAHFVKSATSPSTLRISSTLRHFQYRIHDFTAEFILLPLPSLLPSEGFPSRSSIAALNALPNAASETPLASRNPDVNPSNSAQNSRCNASCSCSIQAHPSDRASEQSNGITTAESQRTKVKPSSTGVSKARLALVLTKSTFFIILQ